jgi:hypothetical protein
MEQHFMFAVAAEVILLGCDNENCTHYRTSLLRNCLPYCTQCANSIARYVGMMVRREIIGSVSDGNRLSRMATKCLAGYRDEEVKVRNDIVGQLMAEKPRNSFVVILYCIAGIACILRGKHRNCCIVFEYRGTLAPI